MPAAAAEAGRAALPRLGLGLGLRSVHFDTILREQPEVDWFEAISENFMDSHGRPRAVLNAVAERYPVVLHGVSLSIGSADPLDRDYLARLKRLANEVKPAWVSDHLCWTGMLGLNSHDLLPVPLTGASLTHIAARVAEVQDFLERPLILENPSAYVRFADAEMDEPEFLSLLSEETGCGLLLDVNNAYVSCFNARRDPADYLAAFPLDRVVQIHLAGHQHLGTHIVDTHDGPVAAPVWELFRRAWNGSAGASTLLEWDDRIPSFEECHAELLRARDHMGAAAMPIGDAQADEGPERVSNPTSFLVPDAMDSVAEAA